MINPEQRQEMVNIRLQQAHETMHTAEKIFELGDHRSALNRVYYAMFYAVSALALRKGFQTAKHAQLLGWFNKTFVKPGIFEPAVSRILRKAFDRRLDADYEFDPLPDAADFPLMLADMKTFIAQIEAHLQK